MDFQKQVQASHPRKFGQLIQVLNDSFQDLLYSHIDPVIKQWMKTLHNCLIIGAEITSRILGGHKAGVPSTICQVALKPEQREKLARGEETELIEGFISKKGNQFAAYLRINGQGDLKFRFPDLKKESPVPDQILGVSLNKEDQLHLERGEETALIKGLKGKRGIPFNAYLKMDAQSKLIFRYEERNKPPENSQHEPAKEEKPVFKSEIPGPDPASADPERTEENVGLESFKEIYGRKLEPAELDLLQTQGQTGLLDGFRTSSGKEFSARLGWKDAKLSLQIPQRQLDTGITMTPKKLFGIELGNQNRRLLAGGRSSELIQNMISPQGNRFDGWLKFNDQHHLCVKSVEKEILIRSPGGHSGSRGMGPTAE